MDVDDTEEEIRQFRDQNAEKIERNKRKPTKDDLWIRAMLEEEQNRQRKLQDEYAKDEMEKDQNRAIFNPKAIIDELRSSDLPAEVVLDRQRKKQIEHEMAEKEEAQRRKRDKLGWNIYIKLINSHFCRREATSQGSCLLWDTSTKRQTLFPFTTCFGTQWTKTAQ